MTTPELRASFLKDALRVPGACQLAYWEVDRAIIGFAVPQAEALELKAPKHQLGADYFCERRELGVINLGGSGSVSVDGKVFELSKCQTLYIGRGAQEVLFSSSEASNPAIFYLVSYPAHASYPTTLVGAEHTNRVALGSKETCNERVIYQQIHEGGVQSCQLVMGYTELAVGSVWNTFPPHTHQRRSEVYNYFDLQDDQLVMHFMGPADSSRNLVVRNHQPVLSPAWSMHAGAGSANYKFVWAMGGENQQFSDMDAILLTELK
jgi:4-deoxy-L-threo-5-hexosulose-uronate ketol-isomerase